jgi:DNA-binding CsgD family transcriptional regulator
MQSYMTHFYLIYFVIALLTGIVSLSIGAFIYAKTKEPLLSYYLLAFSTLTVLVGIEIALWYVRINLPSRSLQAFHHATGMAFRLALFTHVLFIHYFFSVSYARLKNLFFGLSTVMVSIISYVTRYIFHVNHMLNEYIGHTLTLTMFLYIILQSLISLRNIQEERRDIAQKFVILLGVALPGILADMLLEHRTNFRFFPMIYCAMSVMFTHYFFTTPVHNSSQQPSPDAGLTLENSLEAFFQQHRLSPREQEAAFLLLQGCSNQQIGEQMFISLSTVKKHLRSIYVKCGINSRYALLALCKPLDTESFSEGE